MYEDIVAEQRAHPPPPSSSKPAAPPAPAAALHATAQVATSGKALVTTIHTFISSDTKRNVLHFKMCVCVLCKDLPAPSSLGEALQQRMNIYKSAAEGAKSKGDDRKARMHERIMKVLNLHCRIFVL